MKLDRNKDTLCGRPTRKDVEQNGSVCKPYERSIYEGTFMSEPIENYVIPAQMSHQIIISIKSVFRSVIVLLDVINSATSEQQEQNTVAHNFHIKTKCSQQITNRSQQITNRSQKIQIAHSKFKSFTANSNRSQQIKVAHSKFKLLTANYKLLTPLGVFGYLQPAVQLN